MNMFKSRWFTLMEIMIVITIIAILIPIMTPEFSKYIARARDASRITDLSTIKKALLVYEQDNDGYPISFAQPASQDTFFAFNNFAFINEAHAIWWGWGGCPMIMIMCFPGFHPYQDPVTCANSCIPVTWTRTDDQCASYLNDTKFVQIIGKIPKDPQGKKPFPCLDTGDIWSYGYATGTGADGNVHFILTAELESVPVANVGYNTIQTALVTQNIDSLKDLSKWAYVDIPSDIPYYVEYE